MSIKALARFHGMYHCDNGPRYLGGVLNLDVALSLSDQLLGETLYCGLVLRSDGTAGKQLLISAVKAGVK